ncbi:TetR/AcrR family transcriptional regulator [Chitinophaga ginsengisoli]|uniref:TetR family transcriptional regulator n=1 Tax=Chitinophaga ginsengisoli TaxID=363837 RepID=A0A2P8FUG0_9BACT|nr:TetR/AcrR family transcriptional regulator [Chitinophaga ginsengisoli]PSL25348.1 TetR family transcriptional regulator [Chitinophaga ginsengisoli]
METKEKILTAALKLYNQKGINTTTRHIAASMDISVGNLHYHFKHTDDIIFILYERLANEFDTLMAELAADGSQGMTPLYTFMQQSFDIGYKYRFFFLNFVELSIRIPAIQKSYQQLTERRVEEFGHIFQNLVNNGIFRNDIPQKVWSALIKQIFIVGDFWLSNNALTMRLKGKEAAASFIQTMEAIFYPYLA